MLDDFRGRGVKFRSLTEAIDTTTRTGRAMWQIIGPLAELERSLTAERTQAGMKEARRRGVKFGQRAKLSPAQIVKARKLIEWGNGRKTWLRPECEPRHPLPCCLSLRPYIYEYKILTRLAFLHSLM
jgi:DNA invertase Pin-like site-specific DNA recombinase